MDANKLAADIANDLKSEMIGKSGLKNSKDKNKLSQSIDFIAKTIANRVVEHIKNYGTVSVSIDAPLSGKFSGTATVATPSGPATGTANGNVIIDAGQTVTIKGRIK